MFDIAHTPAFDALYGFDPDDSAAQYHLNEVVRHMPKGKIRGLLADIIRFERGGDITEAMGDVLRRAACHAEAERISNRLDARHSHGTRFAAQTKPFCRDTSQVPTRLLEAA